ncbi:hypothetical protein CINF_0287 [Candidatus Campylobacter infans]|uniref:Uncharacterized protein n=1 Tax=Candidatus Campylobacter infans TaxID=2561898 RepID=A0A7H9CKP7_9BACT|nr:hypothetical protein [Candidatus Campylobacter infans]QLI04834.1 hypothetical protein CINF_0287 [Candidatus Campylobacter infans]
MNPNKELVCQESGKIFRLYTNGIEFSKIKLDNGQNNERKKCDYLIIKSTNDIQIFIELKGNKIATAYRQILASYDDVNRAKNLQVKSYAAIVCQRFPQKDTTIQNLHKKANKIFVEIFIKNKEIQTQYNSTNNTIEKTN